MLISFAVNGYKTFNSKAEISFKANNKIKNTDYVFKGHNILKSAIIYGPNNTGKSTFVEALTMLKKIIKLGVIGENFINYEYDYNFFLDKKNIIYQIEFVENNRLYNYLLEFALNNGIIQEVLKVDNKLIFDRSSDNNEESIKNLISIFKDYKEKLVVSMLSDEYKKYTDDINSFFDRLCILDRNFNFEEIGEDLSSLNKDELKLFNELIKSGDISIDNVEYIEELNVQKKSFKVVSYYKMNNKVEVMPSIISDSDGTKTFMRYILKIIKMKSTGGILVVDEIDRSLHTLLTKAIISLFNSEDNNNIQLLATSHDLLLLDSIFLFRKDQIWFTYKDDKNVYFYSLNDFKANESSVRNKTMESYLKGMFGALPHPNIEEIFYD